MMPLVVDGLRAGPRHPRRSFGPLALLLVFLATLTSLAAAQDLGDHRALGFVFPNGTNPASKDLVFNLGDQVGVEWVSPYHYTNLAFVAQDSNAYVFMLMNTTASSFTWPVNVDHSAARQPFYYLYIEDASDNSRHMFSALFRVDNPVTEPDHPTSIYSAFTTPNPNPGAPATTQPPTTAGTTNGSHPPHANTTVTHSSATTDSASASASASGAAAASSTDAAAASSSTDSSSSSTTSTTSTSKSAASSTSKSPSASSSAPSAAAAAATTSGGANPTTDPLSSLPSSGSGTNAGASASKKAGPLAPGASAGIAIGAVFGAALFSALAWLARRHVKARKSGGSIEDSEGGSDRGLTPLPGSSTDGSAPPTPAANRAWFSGAALAGATGAMLGRKNRQSLDDDTERGGIAQKAAAGKAFFAARLGRGHAERPNSQASSIVLVDGKPIGAPMEMQHTQSGAEGGYDDDLDVAAAYGYAQGSPMHDQHPRPPPAAHSAAARRSQVPSEYYRGMSFIQEYYGEDEDGHGTATYRGMPGPVNRTSSVYPAAGAPGLHRAPSSVYDSPTGGLARGPSNYGYGKGRYAHEDRGRDLASIGQPVAGHARKFSAVYWDNLRGGQELMREAPRVHHDELPVSARQPAWRGEMEA